MFGHLLDLCSLLRNWQISTPSLEQTGNPCLQQNSGPPLSGPSSLSVLECGSHPSPTLFSCVSCLPFRSILPFPPRCLQCPQPPGKSSAQCLLHLDVTFLIGCSSLPASSLFNLEKSSPFRILLCAEAFYLGFFCTRSKIFFFFATQFLCIPSSMPPIILVT